MKVRNDYLEFYAEKKISPVHQDISNIAKHYRRREKLYRQCGVPVGLLKNKEVLEVGPGSGYNTLAFFAWNIAHVDLVEPNRTAVADMEQLFHKIDSKKYKIYPQIFEEYATQCERKYDFVVAEGFLNNLPVATDIFHKLLTFVKIGGVIVVTCTDCISFFVEYLKRLSALALAKDICGYERKVEYLTDIFEPQLRSLIGVSRSARDWVEDNIFNPAGRGANLWGIGDLLQEIPDEFHVLGSSPQIFSDISWYKDLRAPSREEQQEQLKQKHATLLLAGSSEIRLNDVQQQMLEEGIMEIIKHGLIFEEKENLQLLEMISKSLIGMEQIASNISDEFLAIVQEASACFSILAEGLKFDYAEYPHFFKAFGRELNYIALQRDMEYTT